MAKVLTPEQQDAYFKEQDPLANPISPKEWFSRLPENQPQERPEPLPTQGQSAGAGAGETDQQRRARSITEMQIRAGNQGKQGFDVLGNPIPGYTPPTTGGSTSSIGGSTYTPPRPAQSVEEIQAQKTREAQAEIDALNRLYDSKLAEQRQINKGQERQTSAVSTLTGLAGSTEANVQATKTEKLGKQQLDAINNERGVMIQSVLSDVRSSAVEEARYQTEQSRLNAQEELDFRAQQQEKAVKNLTTLSQSGVTADGLAKTDPEAYQALVEQVGGEAVLKSMLTLNRPVDTIIDKKLVDGKYIIAYQNPITGETRVETTDLGLPTGYSKTIDAGNRILAVPDDWSGDPTELITINKGLTPSQVAATTGGGGGGEPSGSITRDVQSIMDGVLNLNDVSVAGNYRAQVAGELRKKFNEAKEAGDIYGTMRASAAYDKEVSDTFLQSMEKTTSVLGQLGVLQENIAGTRTGPIVGAFRGKNPWDTNAQTIKAQLNAIVPNLARGVYGEVGVLTDNDIRTYSKTLPNLTSTEDVRNAVLYITMDMIRRNVENKIKNQASGQRDMSGFAEIYRNVVDTTNNILATIPGAVQGGGSDLAQRVSAAGYDYQAMRADGLSDEEIEQALQ